MKRDAQKRFSLIDNGIFKMPCTKLLLINVRPLHCFPFTSPLPEKEVHN